MSSIPQASTETNFHKNSLKLHPSPASFNVNDETKNCEENDHLNVASVSIPVLLTPATSPSISGDSKQRHSLVGSRMEQSIQQKKEASTDIKTPASYNRNSANSSRNLISNSQGTIALPGNQCACFPYFRYLRCGKNN